MITVYYLTDAEMAARRQDTSLPESERYRFRMVKPGTVLTKLEYHRIHEITDRDIEEMHALEAELAKEGKYRVDHWVRRVKWEPVIVPTGKEA